MQVIGSVEEMQKTSRALRAEGKRISLVPTMGYLHEGHLSLIRIARENSDAVIVSHYVNPAQFGPGEDFDSYPRDFNRDYELCEREAADIIFRPSSEGMYLPDHSVFVVEDSLSDLLEGAHRAGHFRGVLTIVAKLFNAALPDCAIFGSKDVQQLILIRRMVRDLNFPIEIISGPTVREHDGLALSSRNAYLSEKQRREALVLNRSLMRARELYDKGERDADVIRNTVHETLKEASGSELDYADVVDINSLRPVKHLDQPALVVLAVRFGNTRLIDNTVLAECNIEL